MLNFYIFILFFYLSIVGLLIFNTRHNSFSYVQYQQLLRQKLLKVAFSNNLLYHNLHIGIIGVIHLYVTWCAVGILKNLGILNIDSIIGILIISIVFLLFLIKRILTLTVAKTSVLYL